MRVKVNGVDVFHPNTGEVRSDGADGIACWFIDTDYNEESFFVRHAYFLGANDPYRALKTTLKAEINAEAWATLNSDTSRPFDKPKSGRIAVKVINHLGDEVMKIGQVEIADCPQRIGGGAVLQVVRQRFQPGGILRLQFHQFGDGVMPASGPAAMIRAARADDRRASRARGTMAGLAFGIGHRPAHRSICVAWFHSEA